jgi:Ubiquitin family
VAEVVHAVKSEVSALSSVRCIMGDAATPVDVQVTFGRSKHCLKVTAESTWGDILEILSKEACCDATGIRLLFKGKTANPMQTLADAKVKSGVKLMAMKTKAQHVVEQKDDTRSRLAERAAAAEILRSGGDASTGRSAADQGKYAGVQTRLVLGDAIDGTTIFYVRVVQGLNSYLVELDETETLRNLKLRLAPLCDVAAKDQRLLFKGMPDIDEASTFSDIGAKRGSTFLLLTSMRHHDAQEAKQDIIKIEKDVRALEERTSGLRKRLKGRLLHEYVELTVSIGQLEGESRRLRDNLESLRGQGGSVAISLSEELENRLCQLDSVLSSLREHVPSNVR